MSQFKAVNPGEVWTVNEITALDQLILEAGGEFTDCRITGRITASESRHHVPFVEGSFAECGRVTSKAKAPVNNGVLVTLDAASCWTVPDTCYLTSLTLAEGAQVQAPAGKQLKLTVSGVETPITAGSFVGDLVLTVN